MFGKKVLSCLLITAFILSFPTVSLAEIIEDHETTVSSNIVYDAAGGEVFLDVPGVETNDITYTEEQYKEALKKLKELDKLAQDIDPTKIKKEKDKNQGDVLIQGSPISPGSYYDYEPNPIYWFNDNGVDLWARHTLGERHPNNYLLTYGDFSWYTDPYESPTAYYSALPYRYSEVSRTVLYSLRDLGTNNAITIRRKTFGPNQNTVERRYRICDLSPQAFTDVHGSTSGGLFYGRTWIQVIQYI